MAIKHSKYKNTGLIFEFLLRKITSDTIKGKESPALKIIKEFYSKNQLNKEYNLYNIIKKNKGKLTLEKSKNLINEVLSLHKNLNYSLLNNEKYNLIKEIKKHYEINEFFSQKIPHYTEYASLYKLFESRLNESSKNIEPIINNKETIYEFLSKPGKPKINENNILEELKGLDKNEKLLTFKILSNNFNKKYSKLTEGQKDILSNYINIMDSQIKLKEYFNNKINIIKENLIKLHKLTKDKSVKIKLNEVNVLLNPIDKQTKIKNDDFLELLICEELIYELKKSIKNG